MSTRSRNHSNGFSSNQLRRAVEAILAQTHSDLEFIIADDASTDGTASVLQEYAANDRRIQIHRFNESCEGFTSKRYTFLAKQASSEYIVHAFDDEMLYSSALESLLEPFKHDSSLEMSYGIGQPIDATNGNKRGPHGSPWSDRIYTDNIVPCGCTMVKKSVFDKLGYGDEDPELRRISDHEFWIRMRYNNCKVLFIEKVLGEGFVGNKDSVGATIPLNIKVVQKILKQKYPEKFRGGA